MFVRRQASGRDGFEPAGAIASIRFTDARPTALWPLIGPGAHGYWASADATPRGRRVQKRRPGTGLTGLDDPDPIPLYQADARFVAGLYSSKTNEKLFM